ncbi:MAG TPA: NUDIX hydrolase [Candidatus Paceibacterota bacterium]
MSFQLWDAEPPKDRASIVLPVTSEDLVVVLLQYCQAIGKAIVEVPGGVPSNDNEPDDEVAKREVEEETGFEVGELIDLGSAYWEPHYKTLAFSAFLAKDCRNIRPARPDATESILVETLTWDEWMAVCRDVNLVRDSKSLTVTFLAMPYLGKL